MFISGFDGGEVFRTGLTFRRGRGRVFYFGPGHEEYPIYHEPIIQQILRNAVHWVSPDAAADPGDPDRTRGPRQAGRLVRGGLPMTPDRAEPTRPDEPEPIAS